MQFIKKEGWKWPLNMTEHLILRRTGRAGVVLRALGKNYIDGVHDLFPIPQIQIDRSNGKLIQNPGY